MKPGYPRRPPAWPPEVPPRGPSSWLTGRLPRPPPCSGPAVSPRPREGSRVASPEPTGPEVLRHGGGSPFPSHLACRPPARTTQRAVLPGS
ncbi:unnamed protein product [Rangifer tarandus platyrhynchus]|uniref:Uncharacterized protein n=2 Tax=Rangifer tarandus platyrhynchus TaxID=3082113 RepID=A0ACB0EN71_RANTA|nr:unnamed protein product [Rangifer tarandus platyrhynchus]CAI9702056.1 unnamed protein product [Rangifer tarandus platyrhynchus]